MTWHNPTPFRLVPTSDGMSFRDMGPMETGLPLAQHPGAFGVVRRHHVHEGVDFYLPQCTPVLAVEDGVVADVRPFTGPHAGPAMAHWRDTYAVWVDGAEGTTLYGEIAPHVKPGQRVVAGEIVGVVLRVLRHDKGRPTSMLHLERHVLGSREAPEWYDLNNRPAVLRDPTPLLLTCL